MVTAVFINAADEDDIRFYVYDKSIKGKFYFDIRAKKDLFDSLSCDGKELSADLYTVEAVSDEECFVVVKNTFMDQLPSGEHQFDIRLSNDSRTYPVKVQVMP